MLILFGSAVFLVFDPLSLLTRSATTLVYPAVDRGLRLAGDVLYLTPPLRGGVDSVTEVLTGRLVFTNGLAYKLQLVHAGHVRGRPRHLVVRAPAVVPAPLPAGRAPRPGGPRRHLRPSGRRSGVHQMRGLRGRLPHGRRPRRRGLHRLLPLSGRTRVRRRLSAREPSAGAGDRASSTCTTPAAELCSRRAAWPSSGGFFLFTGLGPDAAQRPSDPAAGRPHRTGLHGHLRAVRRSA